MIPKFVHAGGRGAPLRPSGSCTVPTIVRPYRVGSGALRVVVSVTFANGVVDYALPTACASCSYKSRVNSSLLLAGRLDVYTGNHDCRSLAHPGIHLCKFP